MPTDHPSSIRLFSDQLMVEMGHALIEKKLITREQIDDMNSRRMLTGESLARTLVKEALVKESDVLDTLSSLTGIPFRHIADLSINPAAVKKMQARVALRYNMMPMDMDGGTITLATSQVPSPADLDALRMVLNMAIQWILCTETDIDKSIKHFYGLGAETIDHLIPAPSEQELEIQGPDISSEDADEGIIKFVNQIISEAIKMRATDIHIEPFENAVRLRYRIDGILQEIPVPRGIARLQKAIASCVKIMAEMNIAEKRKPHDGRINVRCGGDEFDLRVSLLPSAFGETVNMRILNRKTTFIDLEHLGVPASQQDKINSLSDLPHGVVLLTGPTGSGKTTTLYAVLSRINTNEVKIITVEDPVEYRIHGINQIQVHAEIGLTFANVLRSILRHDPDIILIGEIRDMETADIAVRSSLTGHLVFSTLHTNDAPSAITRLLDMGVEPYLVSSCLEGVIAQRLVRRICPACTVDTKPDPVILEEIQSVYPEEFKTATFKKGTGCPNCNFTGYRERIAIFEIMLMNDAIRSLVVQQRPANEIKHLAVQQGMVTLRLDGWKRVLSGVTTVDEIIRVARKAD